MRQLDEQEEGKEGHAEQLRIIMQALKKYPVVQSKFVRFSRCSDTEIKNKTTKNH